MVTGEMPGDPVMSVGTQRNNMALGYGSSSNSARCSHFVSLRKSCASGQLEPWDPSETPLAGWTPEVQHQDVAVVGERPSSSQVNSPQLPSAAGGSILWTCMFQ